jgi:AcrR family transcriptional regulator
VPIQVDRSRQRAHVTDLGVRLVATEGVAALTFRRVAEAAGTSTAIVSTYFTDKRDLLLSTLRAAAARTTVRFDAAIAEGGDLRDCLEAWLPLDDDRLTDWRVIIAFWGVAVTDPELAQVQDGHVGRARGRVEKLLRQQGASYPGSTGVAHLAREVVALTLGIAIQAVFDPTGPAARAQRALLSDGLSRLGARGDRRQSATKRRRTVDRDHLSS